MTTSGEMLLRVENLKKYFRHDDSWLDRFHPSREPRYVHAVDGVDLEIRRGETLGLVGESGCGKSTLARTILRLIEPTSGSVYFKDQNVAEMDKRELKRLRKSAAIVFQDPFSSLNPRYTVRRTLVEPMQIHDIGDSKHDRRQRAADLIEQVGLDVEHLDRHPHEFSGGQRQRIAIARALAVEPDFIVADEPTSALDVSVQANILNLLNRLKRERDLTILFISHDLSVIRYICDRVAVMYLGEIVETGESDDLFAEPLHPYTRSLLGSLPPPDPEIQREYVPLRGDVPTPIDPPSGCRFHPRCPLIIPPEDWQEDQQSWRNFSYLKADIKNDNLDLEALHSMGNEPVEYYEEYYGEVTSSELRRLVQDTITAYDGGNREQALEIVNRFESPCETKRPQSIITDGDRLSMCHRYDESVPGNPPEREFLKPVSDD